MATSIAIEEESGTGTGWAPAHNGYYAGDFSRSGTPASGTGADHPRWLAYNVQMVPTRPCPR
jgi:hypothetical protein